MVYGLGFGVFLVLLVVPALIAIQSDVKRQMVAFRRGVGARRGVGLVRGVTLTGVVLVLGWLAATMGHIAWAGRLWPGLAWILPDAVGQSGSIQVGLAVFLTGVLALVIALFVLGALMWIILRPGVVADGDAAGA